MCIEPKERANAAEALAHTYFDCFRNISPDVTDPAPQLHASDFMFERYQLKEPELRQIMLREVMEYHGGRIATISPSFQPVSGLAVHAQMKELSLRAEEESIPCSSGFKISEEDTATRTMSPPKGLRSMLGSSKTNDKNSAVLGLRQSCSMPCAQVCDLLSENSLLGNEILPHPTTPLLFNSKSCEAGTSAGPPDYRALKFCCKVDNKLEDTKQHKMKRCASHTRSPCCTSSFQRYGNQSPCKNFNVVAPNTQHTAGSRVSTAQSAQYNLEPKLSWFESGWLWWVRSVAAHSQAAAFDGLSEETEWIQTSGFRRQEMSFDEFDRI